MADIILETKIPDEWVTRVKSAFHGMANMRTQFSFENINIKFEYPEKQNGETEKKFAERVLKELGKLLIASYEMNKDYLERYAVEINAVEAPKTNLPDDLFS